MDRKPKPVEVAASAVASATAPSTGIAAEPVGASDAPKEIASAALPPTEAASATDALSRSLLPELHILAPLVKNRRFGGAARGCKIRGGIRWCERDPAVADVAENAQANSTENKSIEEAAFIEVWAAPGDLNAVRIGRAVRTARNRKRPRLNETGAAAAGPAAEAPAVAAPRWSSTIVGSTALTS